MATHAVQTQRALAPARPAPRCLGARAAATPCASIAAAGAPAAAPLASRAAACLRGAPLPPPLPLSGCVAPGAAACRRRGSRTVLCVLAAAAAAAPPSAAVLPTPRLAALAAQFQALPEGPERYKLLLQFATQLPKMPDAGRSLENRVMGCTSQTWLTADLAADGSVRIAGACALRPARCVASAACGHRRTPHVRACGPRAAARRGGCARRAARRTRARRGAAACVRAGARFASPACTAPCPTAGSTRCVAGTFPPHA
jgi:hypothetical protein